MKLCLLYKQLNAQRHAMKKILFELDQVNDLLNSNLLVAKTTGNFYTIYKDSSRTHEIKATLNRLEVIATLQTIRELHNTGLIK